MHNYHATSLTFSIWSSTYRFSYIPRWTRWSNSSLGTLKITLIHLICHYSILDRVESLNLQILRVTQRDQDLQTIPKKRGKIIKHSNLMRKRHQKLITYRWARRSNWSNLSSWAFWTLNGQIVMMTSCTKDAIYGNMCIHRFRWDQGSHVDLVIQGFHPLQALLDFHLTQLFPASKIKIKSSAREILHTAEKF